MTPDTYNKPGAERVMRCPLASKFKTRSARQRQEIETCLVSGFELRPQHRKTIHRDIKYPQECEILPGQKSHLGGLEHVIWRRGKTLE